MTATLRGLEGTVPFVRAAPGESRSYINGFSQYKETFLAVVSLSSHLPDAVLSILLEDDSIPLVLEAMR